MAQGLTHDEIVASTAPRRTSLAEPDLEPASFQPEFAPLVRRLQAQLGGGRALSVLVAGARDAVVARTSVALQIALGLIPTGRNVVVVDTDFARPGLGGLVADPTAEGLTDMVRFGRTLTALLLQPVPEGPWLLPAGSFPEEETLPMQGDDLRSALYRVAQRCDLALYVAPMVVASELHPLFSMCDQAIVVGEDDGAAETSALVDAVRELRSRRVRLAGVVAYSRAETKSDLETATRFEPGFLYSPDLPLPDTAGPPPLEPAPPAPVIASTSSATPGPAPRPLTAETEPDWESPARATADRAVFAPPDLVLPGNAADDSRKPSVGATPEGADPWRPAQAAGAASDSEAAWAPFSPAPAPLPVFEPDETDSAERERRELATSIATRRTGEEARDTARDMDLDRGEFAFEEDAPPSRWPLLLVVAMLVMIVGFVSWALWNRRENAAEERRTAQLLPPAIEQAPLVTPSNSGTAPEPAATTAKPGSGFDDEAAAGAASTNPVTTEKPAEKPTENLPPPTGSLSVPGSVPAPQPATTTPGSVAGSGTTTANPGAAPAQATTPHATTTPPPAPPPPAATRPAGAEFFAVWVASYKTQAQAGVEIRSLRKRGYDGHAVPTDLGDKGIWYRVYAGSYASAAEAAEARDALLQLPEYKSFAQVRRLPRD